MADRPGNTGPTLFTIGYESTSLAALVRTLQEHGIQRLVDVRERPQSRRKGFSIMQLFEALRRARIHYEHMIDLGNPMEIRSLWWNGELEEGRRRYRALLENGRSGAVDVLVGLAHLERTAILCLEGDADRCHRSVIAEVARTRAPDLAVEHL